MCLLLRPGRGVRGACCVLPSVFDAWPRPAAARRPRRRPPQLQKRGRQAGRVHPGQVRLFFPQAWQCTQWVGAQTAGRRGQLPPPSPASSPPALLRCAHQSMRPPPSPVRRPQRQPGARLPPGGGRAGGGRGPLLPRPPRRRLRCAPAAALTPLHSKRHGRGLRRSAAPASQPAPRRALAGPLPPGPVSLPAMQNQKVELSCLFLFSFSHAGERREDMVAQLPRAQAPEGLQAGMVVQLSNGMPVRGAWRGCCALCGRMGRQGDRARDACASA